MGLKSSEHYKDVGEKVLKLLIENNCNTRGDFRVIFAWLNRYVFSVGDGRYIYNGEFYNSKEELPKEAQDDLKNEEERLNAYLEGLYIV